jgi:hypothetical protein
MTLSDDAEKFNTPRHFGKTFMDAVDAGIDFDAPEILPLNKPKTRRVKARRKTTNQNKSDNEKKDNNNDF